MGAGATTQPAHEDLISNVWYDHACRSGLPVNQRNLTPHLKTFVQGTCANIAPFVPTKNGISADGGATRRVAANVGGTSTRCAWRTRRTTSALA